MKFFLKSIGFLIVLCLLVWVFLVYKIYSDSLSKDELNVDAIVVLGASQWNGRPSPALKARLDHALTIFNKGYSKYLILTGGIAEGDTISESKVGKNYLIKKGVSSERILIEEKGKTTKESLGYVSKIITKYDLNKIIFVSHGYHLHRVKKIANDLGIKNTFLSSVEIKNSKKKAKHIIRESLIYILYLINPDYSYSK